MFGQRPSKTGKQLSQAQHLTRAAVKRAGGNIFGKTHDARPRFAGDRVVPKYCWTAEAEGLSGGAKCRA